MDELSRMLRVKGIKILKPIEPERCPYCGKFIYGAEYDSMVYKEEEFCQEASEHESRSHRYTWDGFLRLLPLIVLFHWFKEQGFESRLFGLDILGILILYLGFFVKYVAFTPYVRYNYSKSWWKEPPKEPYLGSVDVKWYSRKKGGIGLPRLRLVNNMIFAVCLVDAEGIPVSHTFCVRLKKRWGNFWKASKVLLIAGKVSEEEWKKADRLVIFNFRDKIGEGKVRKEPFYTKKRVIGLVVIGIVAMYLCLADIKNGFYTPICGNENFRPSIAFADDGECYVEAFYSSLKYKPNYIAQVYKYSSYERIANIMIVDKGRCVGFYLGRVVLLINLEDNTQMTRDLKIGERIACFKLSSEDKNPVSRVP